LLAAAESFSPSEFSKLTDYLVTMAVRYNLIGELRTGVLANYYTDIPPKIRSGELSKAAKVARELNPIYPRDNEFMLSFSVKVLNDSKKARFLLLKIENSLDNRTNIIDSDPKAVNLEHIFPRNPSQEWKECIDSIGKESLQDYTNRLGNLALTPAVANRGISTKSFSEKK
jgi:hypothetical protein